MSGLRYLCICLGMLGLLDAAPVSAAPYVPDVSQPLYELVADVQRGDRNGQTFVASVDGSLVGVRLVVQGGKWSGDYPAGSDTIVRIRGVGADGVPLRDALAQGMIRRTDVSPTEARWITILFDQPYSQSAGERLAVMVEDLTSGPAGWNDYGRQSGDVYPDGQRFSLDFDNPLTLTQPAPSAIDWAFETLVAVPEPSAGLLMLIVIGLRRRGR
jgi:hypothetical protein